LRFSEIHHQDRAISLLRRALAADRTHHAHLFDGPDGVGKERTALALAARMLCDAPAGGDESQACGTCRSCELIRSGNHPDCHLIHRGLHKRHPDPSVRASKGLFLVVDVIRHFLIEPAANAPALGRRRVFIVRDAERMNEGAQNAMLKTLEEPPGSACLILITSSAQRLLTTIRSRCQRVGFDLLPVDYVRDRLSAECRIDPNAAAALASLSQGRLGAAIRWHETGLLAALEQAVPLVARSAFEHPEAFGKSLIALATDLALAAGSDEAESDDGEPRGKSKSASKPPETDQLRDGLRLVFMLLGAIHRDAMLIATGCEHSCALPAFKQDIAAAARQADPDESAQSIEAIATAEQMLDRNVAPQLVCERLAIAFAGQIATA
jgi:DNA polymerase-3 subunit delta'